MQKLLINDNTKKYQKQIKKKKKTKKKIYIYQGYKFKCKKNNTNYKLRCTKALELPKYKRCKVENRLDR